jgi:NADH-quinone oxidoreductase subunit N
VKGRKKASEAALKYSVYGAGAAGVMLYGISLIAGLLNTAHLPTIAAQLGDKFNCRWQAADGLAAGWPADFRRSGVQARRAVSLLVSDVFEGATAEVNAFPSIASKAAAWRYSSASLSASPLCRRKASPPASARHARR